MESTVSYLGTALSLVISERSKNEKHDYISIDLENVFTIVKERVFAAIPSSDTYGLLAISSLLTKFLTELIIIERYDTEVLNKDSRNSLHDFIITDMSEYLDFLESTDTNSNELDEMREKVGLLDKTTLIEKLESDFIDVIGDMNILKSPVLPVSWQGNKLFLCIIEDIRTDIPL